MYYRRDGTPYPQTKDDLRGARAWAKDFEGKNLHIGDDYGWLGFIRVSTVWLGLDHNFSVLPGATPLIFESMAFCRFYGKDYCGEIDIERYSSEKDSKGGHADLYKKWSGWAYLLHLVHGHHYLTKPWDEPFLLQAWRKISLPVQRVSRVAADKVRHLTHLI